MWTTIGVLLIAYIIGAIALGKAIETEDEYD